jgi:hypothetical protein
VRRIVESVEHGLRRSLEHDPGHRRGVERRRAGHVGVSGGLGVRVGGGQ